MLLDLSALNVVPSSRSPVNIVMIKLIVTFAVNNLFGYLFNKTLSMRTFCEPLASYKTVYECLILHCTRPCLQIVHGYYVYGVRTVERAVLSP